MRHTGIPSKVASSTVRVTFTLISRPCTLNVVLYFIWPGSISDPSASGSGAVWACAACALSSESGSVTVAASTASYDLHEKKRTARGRPANCELSPKTRARRPPSREATRGGLKESG
jgi:hypothetical protein